MKLRENLFILINRHRVTSKIIFLKSLEMFSDVNLVHTESAKFEISTKFKVIKVLVVLIGVSFRSAETILHDISWSLLNIKKME